MKSLYDTDLLRWSEEQAAALRMLADAEAIPSADWDRVASAIEDVGRSALVHVEGGLRTMLVQAIAGYAIRTRSCGTSAIGGPFRGRARRRAI